MTGNDAQGKIEPRPNEYEIHVVADGTSDLVSWRDRYGVRRQGWHDSSWRSLRCSCGYKVILSEVSSAEADEAAREHLTGEHGGYDLSGPSEPKSSWKVVGIDGRVLTAEEQKRYEARKRARLDALSGSLKWWQYPRVGAAMILYYAAAAGAMAFVFYADQNLGGTAVEGFSLVTMLVVFFGGAWVLFKARAADLKAHEDSPRRYLDKIGFNARTHAVNPERSATEVDRTPL